MHGKTLFKLPISCQQKMTITKKSLREQANLLLDERKLLKGGEVKSIKLFGAVSPATTNIKTYEDAMCSFLEVYFIEVVLQNTVFEKYAERAAMLLHKSIPHHCVVVLQSEDQKQNRLSVYYKRINEKEVHLRVLEKGCITQVISSGEEDHPFLKALAFPESDTTHLKAFYDYYARVFQNYKIKQLTGDFQLRSETITAEILEKQRAIEGEEAQINKWRRELKRTLQMNEKVVLNTKIHQAKEHINKLMQSLQQS